ncbi:hypothetical protein Pelo_18041 [Pelomyxa schiedti]|nr:hypothetical protein Pelo_18041 [Pelomyxa schiedti]
MASRGLLDMASTSTDIPGNSTIQTAENLNWAVVHYYKSMCCPHLADFHLENSATGSLTKCRSQLCKTLNACSSMSERFAHESRVIIACVLPTLPLTLGKATSSLVPSLEKADMRAPFDATVMLVALLPQAGTVQPMQDENGQYWEYLRRLSLISGRSLAHAPSYHAPPGVGEPRLGKRTCYVLLASVGSRISPTEEENE